MIRVTIILLVLMDFCFAKNIKLELFGSHSSIVGEIKVEEKKDGKKIYVDGVEFYHKFNHENGEKVEDKINILIDVVSKEYTVVDIFSIDLNLDSNEEVCLILKRDGKNYVRIYYYSFEDYEFYNFLSDGQNQEIKKLFLNDKNFSVDKLKNYLNDKLPFIEFYIRDIVTFLNGLNKEFNKTIFNEDINKSILNKKLKFLGANPDGTLIYVDNNKNYYTFYNSGEENVYSLSSYIEGEVDEDNYYHPLNGVIYYYEISATKDSVIRRAEYKDGKKLKESSIQSFEPKILREIFYDSKGFRPEKEYIYRNDMLSKKILYTYFEYGKQKTVENYDDFKQVRNWQNDKNGSLKDRYKTEFQEIDISKGKLIYKNFDTRIYTLYNNKTEKWCYILMKSHLKEFDYFYVKEIFDGRISDSNLKNGINDIIRNGYSEMYHDDYPASLDSSTYIVEKGYYKENKKDGMWVFNYGGQIYSKIYYIKGVKIYYLDYDSYDRLREFGIYLFSKRIPLKKKRYFYGLSE